MFKNNRKRTLVAPKLQWGFAVQILLLQAVAVLALVAAMQLSLWRELRATNDAATAELVRGLFNDGVVTLAWVGPVIGAFSVLVALRFSLRLFGPLPRLRMKLEALATDRESAPLKFRPHDAFAGLDDDVNRVADALEAARKAPTEPAHN